MPPRLEGHADARAQQPHEGPHQAVRGPSDRAALLHDARRAGAAPVRPRAARQPLPGPARGDRESLRRNPRVLVMIDDDGVAISYKVLPRGTPVHSSDGVELGTVD